MKSSPSSPVARAVASDAPSPGTGRRRLLVGAGVAAGAALAAVATRQELASKAQVAVAKPDAPAADGYRLTDHIRRYYETTRA